MNPVKQGVLRGTFQGFDGPGTVYEFADGQRWRQVCKTMLLHRAYMPHARISCRDKKHFLEIEGASVSVEVVPL